MFISVIKITPRLCLGLSVIWKDYLKTIPKLTAANWKDCLFLCCFLSFFEHFKMSRNGHADILCFASAFMNCPDRLIPHSDDRDICHRERSRAPLSTIDTGKLRSKSRSCSGSDSDVEGVNIGTICNTTKDRLCFPLCR